MSIEPKPRHWTLEDWDRMIASGVFREGQHAELIEGEVLEMTPAGDRHVWLMARLVRAWRGLEASDDVQLMQQVPLRLGVDSEPEPDLLILAPVEKWAAPGKPRASDAFLLVEIADTSLHYDLHTKVPLYARNGIPEVWVLDLNANAVHVFRDPRAGEYRHTGLHTGGSIAPEAFPGAAIDLRQLFEA